VFLTLFWQQQQHGFPITKPTDQTSTYTDSAAKPLAQLSATARTSETAVIKMPKLQEFRH
jgi:hypothetical protein